ncbi:MAG: alkaline phosphatase [Phycisphaerales bacterium]|nr:alkaline phosphatase [Phycisphaerales bacterium]
MNLHKLRSGPKCPAEVLLLPVAEALEGRLFLYAVTSAADSGPGTLRQAILDANATPGSNVLSIRLPLAASGRIFINSPLPDITEAISFDQGFALAPATAGVNFDGLVLASDNSSIVVSVSGFRTGIVVRGSNNQIGVATGAFSLAGGSAYANSVDGVRVESGVGNRITGLLAYGNGHLPVNLGSDGLTPNDALDADAGPNELQNTPQLIKAAADYTGTQLTGRLDSKPNTTYHIEIFGGDTAPGGLSQAAATLGSFDVTTDAAGAALFQQVVPLYGVGRYLTATATDPAGNTSELAAPLVTLAASTVVTNTNARGAGSLYAAIANAGVNPGLDVVSFNLPGTGIHRISIDPQQQLPVWGSYDLTIDATTQPGYAGTPIVELVGTAGSTGGGTGLAFNSGSAVIIRGLAIGGFGIGIDMGATGRIEANYIGLAADGSPLPNGTGVQLQSGIVIGGTLAQARNVISGNVVAGLVTPIGIGHNVIQGNYIGTNPAGNAAVPNGAGIVFTSGGSTIGGSVAAARNVISGNAGAGIQFVVNPNAKVDGLLPNYVQGNFIGVAADGSTPLGNGGDGIIANGPASFIGGIQPREGNIIANNGGNGITVAIDPAKPGTGQKNSIRGNSIYANGKLGIDLGNDGVTTNDSQDADAGTNALQNFPLIVSASSDGASSLVSGTFNSTANAAFTLDFYSSPLADPSGYGEGKTYLGSAVVTTDAAGNATFTTSLPVASVPGQVIAATATAADGSTSEFSTATWVALPGDANRDRAIDFKDLAVLAQSYNAAAAKTWSQGDFNGDGKVDFLDLARLAQYYNTSLPAPGQIAPSAGIISTSSEPMPSLASVIAQLSKPPDQQTPPPPPRPSASPTAAKPAPKPSPRPVAVSKVVPKSVVKSLSPVARPVARPAPKAAASVAGAAAHAAPSPSKLAIFSSTPITRQRSSRALLD